MVFGLLRIMESADNFDAGIRLIGRLFFLIRLEGQFPREYGSLIVSSTLQTYKDFYELCGAFCGAAGENVGACAYHVWSILKISLRSLLEEVNLLT